MLNLTVDDTNAASLTYGPGWGVASPADPALSQYFQSTYHASETPGARINLTFSGLAIYLYGSTGPDRGNFSVRYDSKIEFLSAHSAKPRYQQLLFKGTFDSDSQPHTLTLNNTSDDQGAKWVDLDFLTITSNGGSSQTQGFSSTITPLPVSSHSSSSSGSPAPNSAGSQETPNTSGTASTTPPSSSHNSTLILAIVFGALLFLLILGMAAYFIMRRLRRPRNGTRPVSSTSSRPPESAGSIFLVGQPSPLYSHDKQFIPTSPPQPTSPPAHAPTTFNPAVPFREIAPEPEMPESTKERSSSMGHGSSGQVRPWSPLITSPIRALFGSNAKDGEDSMKSTFLKV